MNRTLVHDSAARDDLIGLYVYRFETWGKAQAESYTETLERGIEELVNAPERGRSRASLIPGYWSRRIKHYAVFYTFTDDELRVRRVLHESMDSARHL